MNKIRWTSLPFLSPFSVTNQYFRSVWSTMIIPKYIDMYAMCESCTVVDLCKLYVCEHFSLPIPYFTIYRLLQLLETDIHLKPICVWYGVSFTVNCMCVWSSLSQCDFFFFFFIFKKNDFGISVAGFIKNCWADGFWISLVWIKWTKWVERFTFLTERAELPTTSARRSFYIYI